MSLQNPARDDWLGPPDRDGCLGRVGGPINSCEIKLCDMESARVIQEDEHIREVIGTPDYVGELIFSFHFSLTSHRTFLLEL